MVDIASNAAKSVENDAVLKRQQGSLLASSIAPSEPRSGAAPTQFPDAVAATGASPDLRLEISRIKSGNGFIYKMVDKKTGEVIRQWPTEQMIKMREYIAEHQIQFVDEKA